MNYFKRLRWRFTLALFTCLLLLATSCQADQTLTLGLTDIETRLVQNINTISTEFSETVEAGGEPYVAEVHFSQFTGSPNGDFMALIRFENLPHTAGIGTTVCAIYNEELNPVAACTFAADTVQLECLPSSSGSDLLLYIGRTTFQGISAQEISLLALEQGEWVERPLGFQVQEDDTYYFSDSELVQIRDGTVLHHYAWSATEVCFIELV